jgi:hypothetical protein
MILGAAAGAILGLLRFKVFALLPSTSILGACAIANGVAAGRESLGIVLNLLGAVASPQIGYLERDRFTLKRIRR